VFKRSGISFHSKEDGKREVLNDNAGWKREERDRLPYELKDRCIYEEVCFWCILS